MGNFFIFICCLCFILFAESCYSRMDNLKISLSGRHAIQIEKNNNNKIYHFNIEINGYKVNCSGSKMILWGYPLNFNEGSPADNSYVLFDIAIDSVISSGLMSHGIFDAIYLKGNKRAFLGTGEGYLLYLDTGELIRANASIINQLDALTERCEKPIDWSYNRYPI
ncbi:hypothetical protein ACN0IV_20425 [Trabulsiella odontotermitis]|uniref:hypothetical protein n=1 Tax=Trabulsiella odontotermitis TaxID=379893 RepID=UPI003AC660FB